MGDSVFFTEGDLDKALNRFQIRQNIKTKEYFLTHVSDQARPIAAEIQDDLFFIILGLEHFREKSRALEADLKNKTAAKKN